MDATNVDTSSSSLEAVSNISTREWTAEEYRITLSTNIVLATVVATSCILGIIGNTLVLVFVALSKKLQTITNIFIVSLTLSDLLGCVMLPFQIKAFLDFENGWPLADWVCRMCGALCLIAFKASVAHLALISVNRYIVVTRNKSRYLQIYRTRNVVLMVFFAWMFPICLIMLPPAVGFGKLGYNKLNQVCVFDGTSIQMRIIYMFEEILFGISFLVILGCYLLIYLYVNKHHRYLMTLYSEREHKQPGILDSQRKVNASPEQDSSPSTNEPDEGSIASTRSLPVYTIDTPQLRKRRNVESCNEMRRMLSKREIDITKNLFVVVVSFLFFVLPYILCLLTPTCYISYFKYTAAILVVNSCTNPFIYCLKHPTFREIASCLFRGRLSKIPHPSNWLKKLLHR